jgi:predicted DNA-binding transcriptional regulator AlpA
VSLEHSPARTLLIRRRALLQLLGVSHTTLYSWIAAGTFPPPINTVGIQSPG